MEAASEFVQAAAVGTRSRRRCPGEWSALRSAVAGSVYSDMPGRDFVGVAERLVAAGNVIEPAFLDEADGPLAEWLAARLRP